MDWLTFISNGFWPVTTIVLALIFRTPLSEAARELTNLKLPGGVEASFESDIRRIEAQAEAVELEAAEEDTNTSDDEANKVETRRDGVTDLQGHFRSTSNNLTISAIGLVVHAWKQVETAIVDLHDTVFVEEESDGRPMRPRPMVPAEMASRLYSKGAIESRMLELIDDLRKTRNRVVHTSDRNLTEGQALSYSEAAEAVVSMLNAKLTRWPQSP